MSGSNLDKGLPDLLKHGGDDDHGMNTAEIT
jgi:hypothetical protein